MDIDSILIVADHNDPSSKAVEYGFTLAKALGTKVILLGVINPGLAIGNPDAGIFPDDALAAQKSEVNALLVKLEHNFGTGVKTEILIVNGELPAAVTDAARAQNANLIVIGSHTHTGLAGLFSRDVSNAVINSSPVPVCVIPARH